MDVGFWGVAVCLLTEINDRSAESVEQDQTARTCSLIFLYTLRKMHGLKRTIRVDLQAAG